jgi:hypothetical protein
MGCKVPNCTSAEKVLHRAFKDVRIDSKKEHFLLSKEIAIEQAEYLLKKEFGLVELEIYPSYNLTIPQSDLIDLWWSKLSTEWLFLFSEDFPDYLGIYFIANIESFIDNRTYDEIYENLTDSQRYHIENTLGINLFTKNREEGFNRNVVKILYEIFPTDKDLFCEIVQFDKNIIRPNDTEILNLWRIKDLRILQMIKNLAPIESFLNLETLEIDSLQIDQLKHINKLQKLEKLTISNVIINDSTTNLEFLQQLGSFNSSLSSFKLLEFASINILEGSQFLSEFSDIMFNSELYLKDTDSPFELTAINDDSNLSLVYNRKPLAK